MNKTDTIRKAIQEHLANLGGKKIQQKDLIKYLQDEYEDITIGVIRGVLNKMDGSGGIYIPIKNIRPLKEKGKAFYIYDSNYEGNVVSNHKNQIIRITNEFEIFKNKLKNNKLLLIDPVELSKEEINCIIKISEYVGKIEQILKLNSSTDEVKE